MYTYIFMHTQMKMCTYKKVYTMHTHISLPHAQVCYVHWSIYTHVHALANTGHVILTQVTQKKFHIEHQPSLWYD